MEVYTAYGLSTFTVWTGMSQAADEREGLGSQEVLLLVSDDHEDGCDVDACGEQCIRAEAAGRGGLVDVLVQLDELVECGGVLVGVRDLVVVLEFVQKALTELVELLVVLLLAEHGGSFRVVGLTIARVYLATLHELPF